MIKKYAVSNTSEYIELVKTINEEELGNIWLRGHSSASHRLLPGVLRDTVPLTSSRGDKLTGDEILFSSGNSVTGLCAERMLEEFKRKSLPFLDREPSNDFEWLFLMQHHGVPTRLLDWTTNALVALFFAVESLNPENHVSDENASKEFLDDNELSEDGAAVFVINPSTINGKTILSSHPIDVSENYDEWSHYVKPMEFEDTFLPLCVLAPHISPRIRAQSGTFTLHGANIWALDYYTNLRPLIRKIFIPYSCANEIREELTILGITQSFIYPDLDGISKEIKQQEVRRYSIARAEYLATLESD